MLYAFVLAQKLARDKIQAYTERWRYRSIRGTKSADGSQPSPVHNPALSPTISLLLYLVSGCNRCDIYFEKYVDVHLF